jgi:hypothetical protein
LARCVAEEAFEEDVSQAEEALAWRPVVVAYRVGETMLRYVWAHDRFDDAWMTLALLAARFFASRDDFCGLPGNVRNGPAIGGPQTESPPQQAKAHATRGARLSVQRRA